MADDTADDTAEDTAEDTADDTAVGAADQSPLQYPELRYSDCPSVEVEVRIAASPVDVFALVSDIDLPARFSSEFRGARWLDGASGPAVGARFAGRNEHPSAGEWETVCTVSRYEPPETFEFTVGSMDGGVGSTWRFAIEADGEGCLLRQFMRMGPARSFINFAIDAMPDKESRILNRRSREHRDNMAATLAGVKMLAEAAG